MNNISVAAAMSLISCESKTGTSVTESMEGVEWSDYGEDIPDFSEEDWIRSETPPVVNENRTLHVCKPFDESIGNEFLTLFEPALVYFNGW